MSWAADGSGASWDTVSRCLELRASENRLLSLLQLVFSSAAPPLPKPQTGATAQPLSGLCCWCRCPCHPRYSSVLIASPRGLSTSLLGLNVVNVLVSQKTPVPSCGFFPHIFHLLRGFQSRPCSCSDPTSHDPYEKLLT